MKEDWNILQILRHSRHDWLNFVQLIKGNLALKKYDRIEEIIQEIVNQTQQESKLSNLHIPQLASELLVFNWKRNNHFQLEFEVLGPTKNLETFEVTLLHWFLDLANLLNTSCQQFAENHLLITIEVFDEDALRINFDFHGNLLEVNSIKKFVENESSQNEQMELVEFYINNEEFYLVLKLM
ncbi:hypothetical protein BKP37_04855 [Anaerobacillus alkalilacustris]|uniref:Sporulation initiation phosphotransferase B C-terminal domain-containing protein n=1 Tax=Anaerobacillus alkalilacustris TaxID=393763 RepID=A0A1S2LVN6_9BACI|nr:Spo0B C-terminal domain-containing protein [Anaerobacillus alkalilacustris]OIJ16569.1 hypothetical protein BKP37_04855 [Anaerobacillus alkalilacustris]